MQIASLNTIPSRRLGRIFDSLLHLEYYFDAAIYQSAASQTNIYCVHVYSVSYNGCMVRSLSAAIPQIVPVVTTDVGHLVDSPVVTAVETIAVKTAVVEIAAVGISALSHTEAAVKIAAVVIYDLSQTEAAVVPAVPDSADVVSAAPASVPAVPVTADTTIFDPAASHRAIDARLRSH